MKLPKYNNGDIVELKQGGLYIVVADRGFQISLKPNHSRHKGHIFFITPGEIKQVVEQKHEPNVGDFEI